MLETDLAEVLKFKVIENKDEEIDETLSHISVKINSDGSFSLVEERGFQEVPKKLANHSALVEYIKELGK